MRLVLGVATLVGLAILVQAIPRPKFGMDQCSQCMKDVLCHRLWTYQEGPDGERMVHRCLKLGPLGHCMEWTSGCTMDGKCPWTDQGERWIGQKPERPPPVTDIRNGPWGNLGPICWAYGKRMEYKGCYEYELRGVDNFVRRCLSVEPREHCTEWTEWCNVRGPCPWAYEERYGEPMKRTY
ncbi:hypothetical protein AAVH_28109 [Aphelenchoides avenae]|nr:hypothetical protein AAVH_28109 [Aphelenchus avenae]